MVLHSIEEFFISLLSTFSLMLFKRWYVFTFLASYLFIASLFWGLKRSLLFILVGYTIAWLSEASSIRNGFPYGYWEYHYEEMSGELMVWGVPIWDSISYTFLCFSGYIMALFLKTRSQTQIENPQIFYSWSTIFSGSACTTLLDIIIDPVAHRGSEWFLGDIYHYTNEGIYFGIPLSNFAGWLLVSFCILGCFRLLGGFKNISPKSGAIKLGVALYSGIFLFNWSIALYLQAWGLALASLAWGLLLIFLALRRSKQRPYNNIP